MFCPNCGLEVYTDEDGVIIECPNCGECEGDQANVE